MINIHEDSKVCRRCIQSCTGSHFDSWLSCGCGFGWDVTTRGFHSGETQPSHVQILWKLALFKFISSPWVFLPFDFCKQSWDKSPIFPRKAQQTNLILCQNLIFAILFSVAMQRERRIILADLCVVTGYACSCHTQTPLYWINTKNYWK